MDDMTIKELRKKIHGIEEELQNAVTAAFSKVKLPKQIQLCSIDIPVLKVNKIGDNFNSFVAGAVQLNVDIDLDKE